MTMIQPPPVGYTMGPLEEVFPGPRPPVDMVNHPPHYSGTTCPTCGTEMQVADILDQWFPTDPHLWQAGKYLARAGRKGEALEDLEKAEWYLKRAIARRKAATRAAAALTKKPEAASVCPSQCC